MKKILPFFSYAFHPIFIPVLGTVLFLSQSPINYTPFQKGIVVFQVAIITFFLPLAFFYLLRTFGKVDTIMLSDTSQRKMPLLLQVVLTLVLIEKSVTIARLPELYFFFLAGLFSTIIALLLVFLKIKASIHMIALSAFLVFAIALSRHFQTNGMLLVSVLLLLNGLVASSRLYMQAHTPRELLLGFIVGFFPQLIVAFYWV
jgi:membrane-associated phospholipid phosphatase